MTGADEGAVQGALAAVDGWGAASLERSSFNFSLFNFKNSHRPFYPKYMRFFYNCYTEKINYVVHEIDE